MRRARLVAAIVMMAATSPLPSIADERTMRISSPSFQEGAEIPQRHTCQGADVSPSLQWSGLPLGTRSLVLIVDDPDAPDPAAPRQTWVHWVVYDIEPVGGKLDEGASKGVMPKGAHQGTNDWKRADYGGPCPPSGRHRYFHKLYALDTTLGAKGPMTKAQVEAAMKEHVIGSAQLIGTYQKTKP